MRIALLYAGEPRFFQEGWQSHAATVRAGRECDVFLHAWDDPSHAGTDYHSTWRGESMGPRPPDVARSLVELYQPKAFRIEPYRHYQTHGLVFEGRLDHPNLQPVLSHLYALRQVSLLKQQYELEQQFRYDAVLYLRYDLAIWERLPLEELDLKNRLHFGVVFEERETGDQVYVSDSDTMDTFHALFHHIPECRDAVERAFPGCPTGVSHFLMRQWMNLRGLEGTRLEPQFGYGVLRPDRIDSSYTTPPRHQFRI